MINKDQILIVDGEPQNLGNLFYALDSDNYDIITAPNGKIVLELLAQHLPSAIIMDWKILEMDGIDTIKYIRSNDRTKYIPVIVSTGKQTSIEDIAAILDSGANDYIQKPFDSIEIIARVKSMITLNREYKKNFALQELNFQQENTYLKEKIALNERVLTTEKLKMIKYVEDAAKLINELTTLKKYTSKEGERIILSMISNIKSNGSYVNWEELETLFTDIHPSFYIKLQKIHPDLTLNNRRLCALIKLNFSSKEIASIFSLQAESIKKARYRLKSKLGLTSDESLYAYIQDI